MLKDILEELIRLATIKKKFSIESAINYRIILGKEG